MSRTPRSNLIFPTFSLAAGLLGSLTTAVQALGATPIGSEFQVNTYTTSSQGFPSVAVDTDGDFVVVWFSNGSSDTDTSSSSVQDQRYDASGSAVGAQFQVNTTTSFSQDYPSIAVDAVGDFVAVWRSVPLSTSVQGQRYDASGSAVGAEFQVNTLIGTTLAVRPVVAVGAVGDFVVVWDDAGSGNNFSEGSNVHGQHYDASGSKVGTEFQVNTYTTIGQEHPAVAIDTDGDFVVVWGGSEARAATPRNFPSTASATTGLAVRTPTGTPSEISATRAPTTPRTPATPSDRRARPSAPAAVPSRRPTTASPSTSRPEHSVATPSSPSRTRGRGRHSSWPPSWASARPPTW